MLWRKKVVWGRRKIWEEAVFKLKRGFEKSTRASNVNSSHFPNLDKARPLGLNSCALTGSTASGNGRGRNRGTPRSHLRASIFELELTADSLRSLLIVGNELVRA